MAVRTKTFYAVAEFSVGAARFSAGDEVTGVALRAALRHGKRFVTSKKPSTSAAESATTNGDD